MIPKGSGLAQMIAFNSIFAMMMLCFMCTVFTDPGLIPESWVVVHDPEGQDMMPPVVAQYEPLELKDEGSRRICRKSQPNVYKPDRAHFCRVIDRCVLKMDHFCPWLNNCIGFYNQKFFVLFIFYAAVLCAFLLVISTTTFMRLVSQIDDLSIDLKVEFRVSLTYLLICLLTLGLFGFFGFHSYLMWNNYTTIEFLEKRGFNPSPDHINRFSMGYLPMPPNHRHDTYTSRTLSTPVTRTRRGSACHASAATFHSRYTS